MIWDKKEEARETRTRRDERHDDTEFTDERDKSRWDETDSDETGSHHAVDLLLQHCGHVSSDGHLFVQLLILHTDPAAQLLQDRQKPVPALSTGLQMNPAHTFTHFWVLMEIRTSQKHRKMFQWSFSEQNECNRWSLLCVCVCAHSGWQCEHYTHICYQK